MSLARRHRERVLAARHAGADAPAGGAASASPGAPARSAADVAAAQVGLRLAHDLRRLKQIQSLERKIEAKRTMLPEYGPWIEGLLAAGKPGDQVGASAEVLPTIMTWRIDVGDYEGAMPLVRHVLRHGIAMPPRFQRQAPVLIVEEMAEAALKLLARGEDFPLHVLEELELRIEDVDMPDEVRAKLMKAIGLAYDRRGADAAAREEDADALADACRALVAFKRAEQLHDRVGVKDRIRKIERAQAKAAAAETEE
ncbi:MAG: phage terminase small subunit [Allosphingosinicella sp.]|uniref:phage terminase small subunit n=1 Tax=Allosphingosinicella sp. TaxID=2823234 RepID=UPI00396061A0